MSFMDYESLKRWHRTIADNQRSMGFLIDPLPSESEITEEQERFYLRWYEGTVGKRHDPKLTTVAEDEAFNDKIRSQRTHIEPPNRPRKKLSREHGWWSIPRFPEDIRKCPQSNLIILPNFSAITFAMRNAVERLIIKNACKSIRTNQWELDDGGWIIIDTKPKDSGYGLNKVEKDMFKNCVKGTGVYQFDIIRFSSSQNWRTEIFMWLSEPQESRYYDTISKNANFWAVSNEMWGGGGRSHDGYFIEPNNGYFVAECLIEKPLLAMDALAYSHAPNPPKLEDMSYSFAELSCPRNGYSRIGAPYFYPIAQGLFDKAMDGYLREHEVKAA